MRRVTDPNYQKGSLCPNKNQYDKDCGVECKTLVSQYGHLLQINLKIISKIL